MLKIQSIADARPVNLYLFTRGDNEKQYRYCDADKNLTINNEEWLAESISDAGKHSDGKVAITLPSDNPIGKLYRGMPPSHTVKMMIIRVDVEALEARVVWLGTVVEAKREDVHSVKLLTAGLSATMDSAGLRLTWGRNCPYSLYDSDCKVKANRFVLKGAELAQLDGASILVKIPENIPAGYFQAGFIEWFDDDGVRETRAIKTHEGNKITLMGGTAKLFIGLRINLYPGCDGRIQTCKAKFNNMLNFGGCPHMPNKSPYDGSRVF